MAKILTDFDNDHDYDINGEGVWETSVELGGVNVNVNDVNDQDR